MIRLTKIFGYATAFKPELLCTCGLFFGIIFFAAVQGHTTSISEEAESHSEDAIKASGVAEHFKKEPRFVPVPIPISNPTIGTGLEVALLYLWPKKIDDTESPTSISGVAGMYTSTESWAAAVFHDGYFYGDRFRVKGALGFANFNLKFFGIGEDSIFRDSPLDYETEGFLLSPQALYRLPFGKDLFLGVKFMFLDLDVTFDLSELQPGLPEPDIPQRSVGLGPVIEYDSRNNVHWPSEGSWLNVTALDFGDYLGGDFDYLKIWTKLTQAFSVTDSVVLEYRFDGMFINGDAPFYELSYINLRGFPRGLYANDQAVTLQGQVRWNVYNRWTALFFGGGGRIAEDVDELGSSGTQWAGGVGFRYMIAPKSKLTIGADFAFGNDRFEFYVQVGDFLTK
jgi:hypothetical protein